MYAKASSSSNTTNSSNTQPLKNTSQSNKNPGNNVQSKTFSGIANLIKLLPTGTVFLFQFLSPVLTNNGVNCHKSNKILTSILLGVCGFNCAFASFTDSYVGSDGRTHYGIVTTKGLWPSPAFDNVDSASYKLRFGDFVHALLAQSVFAVLALLDAKTVQCLYPEFDSNVEKMLMMALPPAVGLVSSSLFILFPYNRHGIGYQASSSSSISNSS